MGILDTLLAALGPEASKKLAKSAAEKAARGVGDALYEKADGIRVRVEEAARAHREQRERAENEKRRAREQVREAAQIEDELAALKKKVRDAKG